MPIFIVFGLTRPGIEPKSTVLVADALSTRPLIGCTVLDLHHFRLSCHQRWSRGHKARDQGRGHKKVSRPRTKDTDASVL